MLKYAKAIAITAAALLLEYTAGKAVLESAPAPKGERVMAHVYQPGQFFGNKKPVMGLFAIDGKQIVHSMYVDCTSAQKDRTLADMFLQETNYTIGHAGPGEIHLMRESFEMAVRKSCEAPIKLADPFAMRIRHVRVELGPPVFQFRNYYQISMKGMR